MERDELEYVPRRPGRKVLRRIGKFLLVCAALFCCATIVLLAYVICTAPPLDMADVAPDGYRSTVLDDQGEKILDLVGAEANRVYVTLDEIPQALQDAFIAIEDERFYQHHGIDLRGIARAALHNLGAGSLSQGASTITQQLIKNNLFSSWTEEKTAWDKINRKLQEQYLALRLEGSASKEWILENYLNTINLGGGTWGVQTAAVRYFGKDVSDLTLSECAVLAGIARSPNGYNPLKNPEASRERQELVLAKMLELGSISQEEYDEALADNVYDRIQRDSTPGVEIEVLSYFEDALIYQVLDDLMEQLGYSEEDAWRLIYRGGITIYSTQDTALQAICEEEINRDSWYPTDVQSSVVVMDPYTGEVKAIVGGRGEKSGSLSLNRAISSVRQPGSTMKVVGEYAAALDSGAVTLSQVYDDAPYTYSDGTPIRNSTGTYAGKMTIRRAITKSVNIVAVKCFQQIGMDEVWSYLQQFGFAHLTEEDQVEALALGGTHGGVTNLELTAAYGAIANEGVYLEPSYYTEVLDREGKVLLQREPEGRTVLQSGTAALLTNAMTDVLEEGTGVQAAFSGVPLAGKSGTSSEMRDVWFVGYSPYYGCGVWGGYDDFSPQDSSAYVKKIWRAIMQRAHEGAAYRDFSSSTELISKRICSKCGLLAVAGLCDQTVQGDMSYWEYFVPGTEPAESCSCHAAVTICESSGQPASNYCPSYGLTTAVYLREGSAGTADEDAVIPEGLTGETCSVHNNWWYWLLPHLGDDQSSEEPAPYVPSEEPEPPPDEEDPFNWFDWRSWMDLIQKQ